MAQNFTKKQTSVQRGGLSLKKIFKVMMEGGYYPSWEKTHIIFNMDDNLAVLEYEEGVLSTRIFFSIEENAYDLFLEASNTSMMETYLVKPVLLEDMCNIMFSCETMCDNIREVKKFLPRMVRLLNESITVHKSNMKKLVLANETFVSSGMVSEEQAMLSNHKLLS